MGEEKKKKKTGSSKRGGGKKSKKCASCKQQSLLQHSSSQAGVAVMKGSKKCPKDGCKKDDDLLSKFKGLVTINAPSAPQLNASVPTLNTALQPHYNPHALATIQYPWHSSYPTHLPPHQPSYQNLPQIEEIEEHTSVPYMRAAFDRMTMDLRSGKQDDTMVKNRGREVANMYKHDQEVVSDLYRLSDLKYGEMRQNLDPYHHPFVQRSETGFKAMLRPIEIEELQPPSPMAAGSKDTGTENPADELGKRYKFKNASAHGSKKEDSGLAFQSDDGAERFTQIRGAIHTEKGLTLEQFKLRHMIGYSAPVLNPGHGGGTALNALAQLQQHHASTSS
jgi:hypothetical protein